MTESEPILLEMVTETYRPRFEVKQNEYLGYAILVSGGIVIYAFGSDSGVVWMVASGIGITVTGLYFSWLQYDLKRSMVAKQTVTNYYESPADDNLNYPDEVEGVEGYQSPFVEWGTDVELFKRLLARYVKAGECISRDGAIVPANADYQQQKGKPAIPNLTKNFGKPHYRVQEAFIMAVMTDELEGDKKKMKPSAHLLSYK